MIYFANDGVIESSNLVEEVGVDSVAGLKISENSDSYLRKQAN